MQYACPIITVVDGREHGPIVLSWQRYTEDVTSLQLPSDAAKWQPEPGSQTGIAVLDELAAALLGIPGVGPSIDGARAAVTIEIDAGRTVGPLQGPLAYEASLNRILLHCTDGCDRRAAADAAVQVLVAYFEARAQGEAGGTELREVGRLIEVSVAVPD